jgi:hypothetical protein
MIERIARTTLGACADAGGRALRPVAQAARWMERDARERIGRAALAALDGVLASPYVDEAIERILASGNAERLATRLLDGPELERIVTMLTESRLADEAVGRVMERALARLPQSDALWALIDEISRSPAVTDAIAQQGRGFADQVADDVRDRSRDVDARLERAVQRMLRRKPRPAPAGGPEVPEP